MNLSALPCAALKQFSLHHGVQNIEQSVLRQFISSTFKKHYNAEIDTFCEQLLGVRDPQGELVAAAGYNLANEGSLFLEQYLDTSIEQHVLETQGLRLLRSEIAEVGNLAASQVGGARMLIHLMTRHLYSLGCQWVVFTATRSLVNSFQRLGLSPIVLVKASPSRIQNAQGWGSYYAHSPWVVLGNVAQGHAHLEKLDLLVPPELTQ